MKGEYIPKDWLEFFEEVGEIYVENMLKPRWKEDFKNHFEDPWKSLMLVVSTYAYEKAGPVGPYRKPALEVLEWARENENYNFDECNSEIAKKISDEYKKRLKNRNVKPNSARNPLLIGDSRKRSIIEFAIDIWRNDDSNETFTKHFANTVKEGNIKEAYNEIRGNRKFGGIRGMGEKIASFFLRDLTVFLCINDNNINLSSDENERWRLQPIDRWVSRIFNFLMDDENISDRNIANKIVECSTSEDINPERVNMGMWLYGYTSNELNLELLSLVIKENKEGVIFEKIKNILKSTIEDL